MSLSHTVAQMAIEYWKVLRSLERAIEVVPIDSKAGLAAHVRYSSTRLEALLKDAGMEIVSFDGMAFELNLPAVAINADEFSESDNLVVERTIEPAVISNMTMSWGEFS